MGWPRREDLNILVVLRAMGCVSDAEAVLHIGCEPAFEPLLAVTLHDARQPGNIGSQRNTQLAALEWIGAPCSALHTNSSSSAKCEACVVALHIWCRL